MRINHYARDHAKLQVHDSAMGQEWAMNAPFCIPAFFALANTNQAPMPAQTLIEVTAMLLKNAAALDTYIA